MSWTLWDAADWEPVSSFKQWGVYPGTNIPMGEASFGWRERSPEEAAAIRAERQRKHEDEVLAEAEAIKARRAAS